MKHRPAPMNEADAEALDELMRVAAAAGAHPKGVSVRISAAYVEARMALKADATAAAIRTLRWLLGHLAEERGNHPSDPLPTKLGALVEQNAISKRVQESLFPTALSEAESPECAWALMSIAEHAFYRLYLAPSGQS